MTSRKPNLKMIDNVMATAELPATRPLYQESDLQRVAWLRQIQDANDEKGLIEEQKESLVRINTLMKDEAQRIYDARVSTAREAMNRESSDADKIMKAGVHALDQRSADLDKVISGLTAAVGASE